MSKRTILQIVTAVVLTLLMLVGCGLSDDDLIITGKWEAEDGRIMEFREFNDEDELRPVSEQGRVILSYPSEGTTVTRMGTYHLAEDEKSLFLRFPNIDLSRPGIEASGVIVLLYALDKVTKDKLVIHNELLSELGKAVSHNNLGFDDVAELQRVTESQ